MRLARSHRSSKSQSWVGAERSCLSDRLPVWMDRGDPADGVSAGPVHSQQVIPKWGFSGPLKSPSSLLTELPPAGPSQDPEGPGRSPCPSEQTTPETQPPPQMKTCARSGYWLDLSRFVPMFDSEDVLNILKKKKVDCVFLFFQIGLFS